MTAAGVAGAGAGTAAGAVEDETGAAAGVVDGAEAGAAVITGLEGAGFLGFFNGCNFFSLLSAGVGKLVMSFFFSGRLASCAFCSGVNC